MDSFFTTKCVNCGRLVHQVDAMQAGGFVCSSCPPSAANESARLYRAADAASAAKDVAAIRLADAYADHNEGALPFLARDYRIARDIEKRAREAMEGGCHAD